MSKQATPMSEGILVRVHCSYFRYPRQGGQTFHRGQTLRMSREDFARYLDPTLNWGGGGVPIRKVEDSNV